MPKFAANLTMLFCEHPFLDRFKAAADCGFSAVEYLFPYDHDMHDIAERLMADDLTQVLFNLPPGDWTKGERGLAALPRRIADFRRSVGVALAYAKASKTKLLHVMSGIADAGDKSAIARFQDNLRFAADLCGPEGITLTIEPLNRRDMPGYFLNSFDQAATFIAALDRPNVKLQFDIYHRQILHGDVLSGLKTFLPITAHIQIASVPARHEPGSGELDDFRVLRALDAMGYDGHVGCEYRPKANTAQGLGWMQRWFE